MATAPFFDTDEMFLDSFFSSLHNLFTFGLLYCLLTNATGSASNLSDRDELLALLRQPPSSMTKE